MRILLSLLVVPLIIVAGLPEPVEDDAQLKAPEDGKHHEGDMILPEGAGGADRNAVIDKNRLWPKKNGLAVVPYTFHRALNSKAKEAVRAAAEDYAKFTCIKLQELSSTSGAAHYVEVFPSDGCWSLVGYAERGSQHASKAKQMLSLGQNCESTGTATHEFMHALGFWHEQSRPDRDQFLTIHWNNIKSDMKSQYEKCSTSECSTQGLPYDANSIMHYGKNFFAKQDGLIAMEAKDGSPIGQRSGMDQLDVKKINKLYGCGSKTVKPRGSAPYPSDRPSDQFGNCGDFKHQCNNPAKDFRTTCAKTCATVPKDAGYNAYSNCNELVSACSYDNNIKEKCSMACKQASG